MECLKSIYQKVPISGLYDDQIALYGEEKCIILFQEFLNIIKQIQFKLEANKIASHLTNQIWWRVHHCPKVRLLFKMLELPTSATIFDIIGSYTNKKPLNVERIVSQYIEGKGKKGIAVSTDEIDLLIKESRINTTTLK